MKKYLFMIISVFLIIVLTACSGGKTASEDMTNTDIGKITTEQTAEVLEDDVIETVDYTEEDIITVYSSGDVMATNVKDVCELSDLTVKVRYIKDVKVYAQNRSGAPITVAEFEVLDVVKGECAKNTITAEYYGGTVSLQEYMQALDEAKLEKLGYNYTEQESKSKLVRFERNTPEIQFTNEDEYLLMMSYDSDKDMYFILCGGYGAPVIKDGAVYNASKEEYIDMTEIESYVSASKN